MNLFFSMETPINARTPSNFGLIHAQQKISIFLGDGETDWTVLRRIVGLSYAADDRPNQE